MIGIHLSWTNQTNTNTQKKSRFEGNHFGCDLRTARIPLLYSFLSFSEEWHDVSCPMVLLPHSWTRYFLGIPCCVQCLACYVTKVMWVDGTQKVQKEEKKYEQVVETADACQWQRAAWWALSLGSLCRLDIITACHQVYWSVLKWINFVTVSSCLKLILTSFLLGPLLCCLSGYGIVLLRAVGSIPSCCGWILMGT